MKSVLVSLLQQRVFAEANVSSNLQNVMSMKCVNVLVSTKKAIVMPEALRRLFEKFQDKLPDRGQHRKRADQQHFITGQPKREVLLAAWHAFTDLREKHAAAREVRRLRPLRRRLRPMLLRLPRQTSLGRMQPEQNELLAVMPCLMMWCSCQAICESASTCVCAVSESIHGLNCQELLHTT